MNKELTIDEILFYHTKTGNRRLPVTDEKIKAAMEEFAAQEKKKEAIRTKNITLYRYCDANNQWSNYTPEDIYLEYFNQQK